MSYQQPGDYQINSLTLESFDGTTYDVREMYTMMRIIENIEEDVVVGELVLYDGAGLRYNAPIIGEERINIRYTVDGSETINRTFAVYRPGEITRHSETEISYTLFMISVEAMINANTKVSKSYRQTRPDQIVSDVVTELDTSKTVNIEKTQGPVNIVLPYWAPFKAINMAARWSINSTNPQSWFQWFENKDGFHFVNIPSLYDQEPIAELKPTVNPGPDSDIKFNGRELHSYTVVSFNDKLQGMHDGQYGETVSAVDPITKQQTVTTIDPINTDVATLNNHGLVSDQWSYDSANQRHVTVPATSLDDQSNIQFEQTVPWEGAVESRHKAITMIATITGFEAVTVGTVVNLSLPEISAPAQTRSENRDQYLSGNYLVCRAEHIFEKQYRIIARLQSNSFKSRITSDA